MLRILTLSVLLGLVLADSAEQGTSEAKPHRGECPGVNEVTECQLIPDGDKQKCKPCENDRDCDGSFKCCSFSGQNKCLLPIFKNPCEEDNDCPELLTCCAGTCTDTCEKY
ncbi:hypothetical protein NDU88_000316 [Pleurodeles waltl]|uniref:WAP domain-containing protein n=1 Tax=Pleurodeles waltl TaxID=8319 RepID=A0AAV7P0P6_PLEWA|nr:hypothetical protein NDU88_000316 [Pleurodeles waltl]